MLRDISSARSGGPEVPSSGRAPPRSTIPVIAERSGGHSGSAGPIRRTDLYPSPAGGRTTNAPIRDQTRLPPAQSSVRGGVGDATLSTSSFSDSSPSPSPSPDRRPAVTVDEVRAQYLREEELYIRDLRSQNLELSRLAASRELERLAAENAALKAEMQRLKGEPGGDGFGAGAGAGGGGGSVAPAPATPETSAPTTGPGPSYTFIMGAGGSPAVAPQLPVSFPSPGVPPDMPPSFRRPAASVLGVSQDRGVHNTGQAFPPRTTLRDELALDIGLPAAPVLGGRRGSSAARTTVDGVGIGAFFTPPPQRRPLGRTGSVGGSRGVSGASLSPSPLSSSARPYYTPQRPFTGRTANLTGSARLPFAVASTRRSRPRPAQRSNDDDYVTAFKRAYVPTPINNPFLDT